MGFVIAFRFYGRYPETGRTFYHPPPCESDRAYTEAGTNLPASNNGRRHSPSRRLGLAAATSLILPSLAAPSLSSVLFSSGTRQDSGHFRYLLLPSIYQCNHVVVCFLKLLFAPCVETPFGKDTCKTFCSSWLLKLMFRGFFVCPISCWFVPLCFSFFRIKRVC